jgi:hypothetical protein
MINLTSSIKFVKHDVELKEAVLHAINKTNKLLLVQQTGLQSDIDPEIVTSTKDNKLKALAFYVYSPKIENLCSEQWLAKVFDVLNNGTYTELTKQSEDTLSRLDIGFFIPKTLLTEFLRGLRIFFLALWTENAILLPMNFSLPKSNRRDDIASQLYPEVLAIYRNVPCERFPTFNLDSHVPEPTKKNFRWYTWRLIIASSWRKVEDISTADLEEAFKFLSKLRANPEISTLPKYPITPQMFAGPLISGFKNIITFDFSIVSLQQPLKSYSTDILGMELNIANQDTSHWGQKQAWLRIEKSYIEIQRTVKKLANIDNLEKTIGRLNFYLFIHLPQKGITPPFPEYFDRKYIVGTETLPKLIEIIPDRDSISATSRFFDFIEETETFVSGREFSNPITRWDKPREQSHHQTTKIPYKLNDFLLIYNLANAISDFSWHVLQKIINRSAPSNWHKLLNNQNESNLIFTADFGLVPKIEYREINGNVRSFDLEHIPVSLLPVTHVQLKKGPRGITTIPLIFGISQVVVALETGLRHSHIRWLDKRTYVAETYGEHAPYFDMCVNTDKAGKSWIRPTSITVLETLNRLITAQNKIEAEHFTAKLNYRNIVHSIYDPISPVFHLYKTNNVYSETSMMRFYNYLVYFFQQLKISQRLPLREPIPAGVANLPFDRPEHFSQAEKLRNEFKSQYTPHGTRATVISAACLFLPIQVVASKISGHRGINDTLHYAVVDETFTTASKQEAMSFARRSMNMASSCTTREDSPIHQMLRGGNIDRLGDFGATAFFVEKSDGSVTGGLDIIASDKSNVRLFPTNICPFGGNCPDDITHTIGARKCGQCPYSIKTIDHLPRILAHSRQLARELDDLQAQIRRADDQGASELVLEEIEDRIISVSCELSAWMLTSEVLINNRTLMHDKININRPDLLSERISIIAGENDKLTETLLRLQDSIAYHDLINCSLELDVIRLKGKLLSCSEPVKNLFPEDVMLDPIEQIRGVARAISMLSGKTYTEIAQQLSAPPSIKSSPLSLTGFINGN